MWASLTRANTRLRSQALEPGWGAGRGCVGTVHRQRPRLGLTLGWRRQSPGEPGKQPVWTKAPERMFRLPLRMAEPQDSDPRGSLGRTSGSTNS